MSTEANFENGNLTLVRTYSASREDVFEAWVETSKTEQWWGCGACTAVRSEIEPRVGGKYDHHMTLEGGMEIPGYGVLTEFDPPARLAYKSTATEGPESQMLITVDFAEVDGGTEVRLVHSGIPDMLVMGDVEMHVIIQGGWTDAFGKLGGCLGEATAEA